MELKEFNVREELTKSVLEITYMAAKYCQDKRPKDGPYDYDTFDRYNYFLDDQ